MSKLDPTQTIITLTDDIPWRVPDLAPPNSVAEAVMAGSEDAEGAYLVMMKWYPGWVLAPTRPSPPSSRSAASLPFTSSGWTIPSRCFASGH